MNTSETNLLQSFQELLHRFNYQGWWPIFEKGKLRYHPRDYSYPKTKAQAFEISLGAILTQNTNWKNAAKALENLYKNDLIHPKKILNSENLAGLIRSSGYYNQKAERLKTLAENFEHISEYKELEEKRKFLLSLKGIGKETADSILLYAFKEPIFVVDAYTRRFLKTKGLILKEYDEYRELFESQLPKDYKIYNEYHALLVEWGKKNAKGGT